MKWIGQHIVDSIARFRNTVDFSKDVTFYQPVNDADPGISIGASDDERVLINVAYQGTTTQTAQIVNFASYTQSGTAHDGRFHFHVDGTRIIKIQDDGIELNTNMGITSNGTSILSDSSGTMTLSNINALDATTETTIEGAIDTLGAVNFQGNITGIGLILDDGGEPKETGASSDGAMIHVDACNVIDDTTSASSTVSSFNLVTIEEPTLNATNASVTTTDAATLFIKAAPASGSNQTITKPWALYVGDGASKFGGDLTVSGTIIGNVTGNLTGNAATATALATSRNFQADLASTSTAGFTGAANCTPGVTGTLAVGNGGTGLTSISTLLNSNVTSVSGSAATVTAGTQAAITTCANLTTVGTIGTGTWNGDVIAEAKLQNQSGTNTGDEPNASVTVKGIVELATTVEAAAGTDTDRAVTPQGIKTHVDSRYSNSVISFTGQGAMVSSGNWIMPGKGGISNHTWNKDIGVNTETNGTSEAAIPKQWAQSGIRMPFACVVIGMSCIISNANGNRQATAGLFFARAEDGDSAVDWGSGDDTEPILQIHADANNEGGSYTGRPSHAEVTGHEVEMLAGDVFYPAIKLTGVTSGGNTDNVYVTFNVHIKTLIT